MSELSYLEKLLDGAVVQWKTIGEVTSQTNNIKWREATRTYRYVDLTAVDIETKKITVTTEITANNAPSRAQKLLQENDVIFATTRPTQQRFCLIDSEHSGEVASTGYCVLRAKQDEVLPKWILHWISTRYFNEYVEENQSGSAYPAISDAKVKECLIPIPCPDNKEKSLAIQSEIVKILDTFTALTAELTAELNMRKKQYNYYHDRLFSFGAHDVKRLKLGELCVVGDGLHGTPEYDVTGDYFFINGNNLGYQKISFNDNTKKVNDSMFKKHGIHFDPINTVFLSINGTIGNVSFYNNERIVLGKSVAYFKIKSPELHTRYLFYFLQTNYAKQYFENQKTGSTIKNLGLKSLRAFEIPIPSDDEQLYIVARMDKFYTLTNSITEGLPREIELRQKQYEYYRDMLFSFPKPEVAEA
ncbi:restriction endonuclease subunit S [Klebsiella variicola]|uniref:restriction endonuclease subunit S n=1 Tax=Klebsiella variicola TaxID=244366 RepID=UPI0032C421E4